MEYAYIIISVTLLFLSFVVYRLEIKVRRLAEIISDYIYNHTYGHLQEELHTEFSVLPYNSQEEQELWSFASKLLHDTYNLYLTLREAGCKLIENKSFDKRIKSRVQMYNNLFHDKEFGGKVNVIINEKYEQFVTQLSLNVEEKDLIILRKMFVVYFKNILKEVYKAHKERFYEATLNKGEIFRKLYENLSGIIEVIDILLNKANKEDAKVLRELKTQVLQIKRKKHSEGLNEEDNKRLIKMRSSLSEMIHEILDKNYSK
jgi:hypothetical protein